LAEPPNDDINKAKGEFMSGDIKNIVQPAVQYCLKKGHTIRELLEAAREVFVEEASKELAKVGEKGNVSRIAVITGLQRPVVKACLTDTSEAKAASLSSRVINSWRTNKKFKGKNNQPRILSCDGDKSEFAALVRTVSKDIHPGTVLFDLKRQGLAEITDSGAKLSSQKDKKSVDAAYRQIGEESRDFISAMLDNIEANSETPPNYQVSSTFDNMDEMDLISIRERLNETLSNFQDQVEKVLSEYDLDTHPDPTKNGGKIVVVGIYTKTT
jgi:hypothetical protein